MSLYNLDIETGILALLIQDCTSYGDLSQLEASDFSTTNSGVFSLIKQQLDCNPQGSVTPMVLADKARGYGIKLQDLEVGEYLEALRIKYVQKSDATQLAAELKRLTVRRKLISQVDEIKKELVTRQDVPLKDMTSLVERGLSSVSTTHHLSEFTSVFETLEQVTEKRGDNPIEPEDIGYQGPFPTMTRVLGNLCVQNQMVCIGARTGNQKSAFGFFYNLHVAIKFGTPILLMDIGEMTLERIQRRAVCCLAEGRIPLWAIASGKWRESKEWTHIIRHEIWPKIRGLKFDYINVGNFSPRERISLIRRFYYQKVGRGNVFGILDDYLKGMESLGKNTAEHQSIGYYVNDMKSLITNELPAWYHTSVQNNRTGIYQGKKAEDIIDSEDQMGLSDRIIQQSDWGFILRWKHVSEISMQSGGLFGNMKLTPVKTREALGREYEKALRPVKLPSGSFSQNYFNLDSKSFFFSDRGDLNMMLQTLGQTAVPMGATRQGGGL